MESRPAAASASGVGLSIPEPTLAALERLETLLHQSLAGEGPVLSLARRMVDAGGKRLRPLLVLLACQSAGGAVNEKALRLAAGVELIHTASLVHDDIMDEARLRRGVPTVVEEVGVSRAIVVGDLLFVKGYEQASLALDEEATRIVAEACAGLAAGQFAEEDLKRREGDFRDYLRVIEQKTAGLIAACAELGAYLGDARGAKLALYRTFGFNLGIAFQLIDDVLDATGKEESLGKDVRSDVRNGAKGLPAALGRIESARPGDFVGEILQEKGVKETRRLAESYAAKAEAASAKFPKNPFSETLHSVVDVILKRDR